ncbi:MAG: hypothetical protein ACJASN_003161, partial [Cyclobacteriaceae bacterium]
MIKKLLFCAALFAANLAFAQVETKTDSLTKK